jgi:hypothetical protein
LFLMYINDLPEYVQSNVHLFADDTIMYLAIHSEDQCAQLQSDLDNLQSWGKDWLMEFNSDKCEVLRVTRKKSMIHHDFTLYGKVLRSVTSARYLGLQLSHDLKWIEVSHQQCYCQSKPYSRVSEKKSEGKKWHM